MSNPLILAIFFCQGLGLDGRELQRRSQLAKAIGWGFVISQIIGPLLAYTSVYFLNWRGDNQIGFMVICCMAPTLVSGAVLAGRAGGDGATALILAVGLNLLGILTIPLNLKWSLGAVVRLDTAGLLLKLVLLVLVPAVIGQAIKKLQPEWARQQERLIRIVPVVALGIIVYLSCSSQADRLQELTLSHLGSLLLPSVTVHLLLLAAGYAGARYLLRLEEPSCRSLAIVLFVLRKPYQSPLPFGPLPSPKPIRWRSFPPWSSTQARSSVMGCWPLSGEKGEDGHLHGLATSINETSGLNTFLVQYRSVVCMILARVLCTKNKTREICLGCYES